MGTKRLFSNRSRISDRESDHGENYEVEEEEQLHSGKRYRASDWPLTSTTTDSPPARAPLRSRNAPNSPSYRRPSSAQVRPSKFLEGSMNDRVSHKPPTTYIGDEEFRDKFDQEQNGDTRGRKIARPKTFTHHPNTSMAGSSGDRSEVSRHSGIFRFGKSLAASFNPNNWKIFSKPQEETEETAQQKMLRERREKAERMYQELKKSGHFRDSTFHPSLFQRQEEKEAAPMKHDSGVEFGERRSTSRVSAETSREEKRMGKVFLEPPQLPTSGESHFSQSPVSTTQESVRKQKAKFHFKKPSLSNIRKSMSDAGSNAPSGIDHHQARRVPSRKDLQKQQKLVKRVSDLEGKLDAARRQLAESLDEPVPSGPPPRVGRTRFIPGAMPSLPSERLLSGYCNPEGGLSESVSVSQIGKAVTMEEPVMAGGGFDSEQRELEEPTRHAPTPPDFDKSLPQESDTPPHDHVMQSVEVEEEESLEIDEPSAQLERPVVQSVKSRQVRVITKATTSTNSQESTRSSPSDIDVDSDYQASESGKHETNPEPSEPSEPKASDPKPSKPSPNSKSKSKKRKSLADTSGVYKPIPESESDLSSIKPRRTAKKSATGNPPRKLQKTSTPPTKSSPQNQRNPAPRHRQLMPGKQVVMSSSKMCKSKVPIKGRQSVSPPPSGPFTGLEYMKPSSQSSRNESGEAKMAAYSAIPSADGEDVPPMPTMPKAVRLASGEVVSIPAPARRGNSGSQLHHTGSKLTKARPSPRKEKGRKEDFEWPEDVF